MDIQKIRTDFPILKRKIGKYDYVYLDNAATTQKPQVVIDTVNEIYSLLNSNIHRGNHYLSQLLTNKFEEARKTIQNFVNAQYDHEIIFTSGTTMSINTIAYTFLQRFAKQGDEIIITESEHHANIVPWQIVANIMGLTIKYIPLKENGTLAVEQLENLITEKTKIVGVAQVANATGVIHPVKQIINIAHKYDIPVMIDAAQSIQHIKTDVQELDCDFLVFSGHKIYGPTGIGVLYGKEKWLEKMPPLFGGGEMIDEVTMQKTTYNQLPFKMEAGTPHYVGAIGLAEAIKYIDKIGLENIASHEHKVLSKANELANKNPNLRIIGGEALNRTSVLSMVHKFIPVGDMGMLLDQFGIAIRVGHHCAQPLMRFMKISGTARLSIAMYNTIEEIEYFFDSLSKIEKMFM